MTRGAITPRSSGATLVGRVAGAVGRHGRRGERRRWGLIVGEPQRRGPAHAAAYGGQPGGSRFAADRNGNLSAWAAAGAPRRSGPLPARGLGEGIGAGSGLDRGTQDRRDLLPARRILEARRERASWKGAEGAVAGLA